MYMDKAKAEKIVNQLNTDSCDDWTYRAVHHWDSRLSKIAVYDETGYFLGYMGESK